MNFTVYFSKSNINIAIFAIIFVQLIKSPSFIKIAIKLFHRFMINGSKGSYWDGNEVKEQLFKDGQKLELCKFGDNIGICLQHVTQEEIAKQKALDKMDKEKKDSAGVNKNAY